MDTGERGAALRASFRRTILLAILLAFPATYALRPVEDNDVFFHVRVGQWIAEHGSVPQTDPFTVFGEGKAYVAYAWLFQLLVAGVHRVGGFVGIAALEAALAVLCALAVWRLVARRAGTVTQAALVAGAALIAMRRMVGPRSWLFTIFFFAVELDLVLEAREKNDHRKLWLLVPLFALWANVHIQFVYGLAVLALLGIECLAERKRPWTLIALGLACAAATLVNPYGLGVWRTVLEYATAKGAYSVVSEHMPPTFRELDDWVVVGLGVAALVALFRKREKRIFPWLLLALGAALSLRARRDVFALATIGAALLASALAATEETRERFPETRRGWGPVLGLVAALLALLGLGRNLSEEKMLRGIAKEYPARAADSVLEKQLPGPVFCSYDWGSYLIFRLGDRKVAIDGRTNLHGDARIARSVEVWRGSPGWESDEDLARSRCVVAAADAPLTALLKKDPRFARVFADDDGVACVFSRIEATK